MKRIIIWGLLGLGVFALARRLKGSMQASPELARRMSDRCERMLANMPASFPPNRMMADLETLKTRTALILETLSEETANRQAPKEILNQRA